MSDVFIPVRLDIWKKETPKIVEVDIPESDDNLSAMEIGGSEGEPLFAIEDGFLEVEADDAKERTAAIASADKDAVRIWVMRNVDIRQKNRNKNVKAGERIGTVRGGDLILMVMDDDSPVLDLGTNDAGEPVSQLLPHEPREALDELDALPLPQDQEKGLTAEEKKQLAEETTGKKPSSGLLKKVVVGGLVITGVWAFWRLAK